VKRIVTELMGLRLQSPCLRVIASLPCGGKALGNRAESQPMVMSHNDRDKRWLFGERG